MTPESPRITVTCATSTGKWGRPELNEDTVVTSPPFYGVIDGATSKTEFDGESPGRRLSRSIAEAIVELPADCAVHEAVSLFTQKAQMQAVGSTERPSASFLIFSESRNEVWSVGDGWLRIDNETHCYEHEIERRAAGLRAAYLYAALETRSVDELLVRDPGRELIMPMLRSEGELANLDRDHPLCWGRVDGRPVPARFIRIITLPEAWTRLVLATDGYSTLGPSFEASEKFQLERVKRDPLMIEDPPSTKGVAVGQVNHDDRTWLELHRSP